MNDSDFALAILDLMPQDENWRNFVSNLRIKVRETESKGLPIVSRTFITSIRDEFWFRHKDDYQSTSNIFSACLNAQKNSQKRGRPADLIATSSSPSNSNKRPCNPNKANQACSNTYCGSRSGHDTLDCIAYKGAKQGQYGPWWRGPWNIHLPEDQRSKANNVPPKTHLAYSRFNTPTVNNAKSTDISSDRSTTTPIQSDNQTTQANLSLSSDANCYAWNTHFDNNIIHATLPVLNNALPRNNSCHHDSGANRHVFHDRSVFENYETIAPLTVKGFGKNLSAIAIGRGTVRLEG
jgi:hypothetical protein